MRIDPRQYTNKLLEMVDEGLLDRDIVISAMATYLSDNDVRDMMEANEMIEDEDDEDQPDPHYFGGEEDEDEEVDPMDFDP